MSGHFEPETCTTFTARSAVVGLSDGGVEEVAVMPDPIETPLDDLLPGLPGVNRLDRRWFCETLLDELGFVHGIGQEVRRKSKIGAPESIHAFFKDRNLLKSRRQVVRNRAIGTAGSGQTVEPFL